MTVLHIMQCTNLGGMEQVAFRVMEELRKDGFDFRIVSPRPFGPGVEFVRKFDAHAQDFQYRGRFGWRDFPAFRCHVRELAEQCSHVWITGTCAASLAAVKGIKKPKVLSHHYHHFEGPFSWLIWRCFYELLCRDLDAITYPIQFTKNEALRIAPWLSAKVKVVPNGYDPHYKDEADRAERQIAARDKLGLAQDALIVGNAGWLIGRKRFDVFLETAAKVLKTIPNAIFVICGGGPLEGALRDQAERLCIKDAVRFEGWVENISDYYRAWDVLLFNSDFDTLPCAPMEAASYGCPTVASLFYGGLGEFIVNGENGVLLVNHNVDILASNIVDMAVDQKKAAEMRAAARRTLEQKFSSPQGVRPYKRFFSDESFD